MVLRAYAKYLQQVRFRFSQSYIEKALITHPTIARDLIDYFLTRHDPKLSAKAKKEAENIEHPRERALDK